MEPIPMTSDSSGIKNGRHQILAYLQQLLVDIIERRRRGHSARKGNQGQVLAHGLGEGPAQALNLNRTSIGVPHPQGGQELQRVPWPRPPERGRAMGAKLFEFVGGCQIIFLQKLPGLLETRWIGSRTLAL